MPELDAVSDAEIDARLRAILESPEYQERGAERFMRWLEELIERSGLVVGWSGYWLAAALGLLILVLLAYALGAKVFDRGLKRSRRARAGGGNLHDREDSPDQLLDKARSLANAGSLRDAALALQHAILLDLCRRRSVRWHASRSDWEWMQVLEPSPATLAFTRDTERLAFGPQPERALFDSCARMAESLLASPGERAAS